MPTSFDQWFAPLPELGLIEVSGADAPKFLQGQATCDILAVNDQTSTLGAFCTPKGRVLVVFRALRNEDSIWLILPKQLINDIVQRLKMYVLRSAVTLKDRSDDFLMVGVVGNDGADANVNDVRLSEDRISIALPSAGEHRALNMVAATAASRFEQSLEAAGYARQDANRWRLEDIRAGLPWVLPGTVEAFIPQMLNLDQLGGIGFKKGCYTGQEVVARTHYLGTVKRHLHRLIGRASELPSAGAAIFADGEEQTVGQVLQAASTPNGQIELLAVLNGETATTSTLRLERGTGEPLVSADPP